MFDTSLARDDDGPAHPARPTSGRLTSRRANSGRPSCGSQRPSRIGTWARTLAAVALLDASASAFRDPAPGARDAAADAEPAGRWASTVLVVIDAAAALIEAGDTDAAFLLLALTEPDQRRPARAHRAMRLLTSTRAPSAARLLPRSAPTGGRLSAGAM